MSDRHTRSYDFTVTRSETSDDGLTLEGYAAVFNTPTSIRDQLGEYEETIAPGAFKRTINADRTPILQFDHGTHPMIGSIPLGAIRKLTEDDQGLYVRARLSDNWLVQPVREAILDGGISGMSFQFSVTQDDWNREKTSRTVREVKLYELGPVVWPAYDTTSVGVRSEIRDLFACENFQADFARAACFARAVPGEPGHETTVLAVAGESVLKRGQDSSFPSTEPATSTSGEEADISPQAHVVNERLHIARPVLAEPVMAQLKSIIEA